jgi:triphosphoribosyl-dephospho-CoA synthetase
VTGTDRPTEVAALTEALSTHGFAFVGGAWFGKRSTELATAILAALPDHVLVRRKKIETLREALAVARDGLQTISEGSDATEQSWFREEAWATLDTLARLTPGESND